MANQIQLVIYEGFLAADPESRFLDSGKQVTNFRFGSNSQYKKGDETVKQTTWMKVVAWGKLGEICNEYLAKGSHVVVTGKLRPGKNGSPETFELKNTSGWGANFEMVASEVRILKGKSDEGNGSHVDDSAPVDEDNFPF